MFNRDQYIYPAIFAYEPGKEISVYFPDLDVATSGQTEDDAIDSACELLECVLEGLDEDGDMIPDPTPINQITVKPNEQIMLVEYYPR